MANIDSDIIASVLGGLGAMVVKSGESFVLLMPRIKNKTVTINGKNYLEPVTDGVSTWTLKSASHDACMAVATFDDFYNVNNLSREDTKSIPEGPIAVLAFYRTPNANTTETINTGNGGAAKVVKNK